MAEENIDNILPQKIWNELEEISKMDISIQQFNEMARKVKSLDSEEKKDENVLKKDGITTLLSTKEKKRYENLGKAFMIGANDAISEIQNAIKKKEEQTLSNKDDIASKIKNAEEKAQKEKSKKGSLFKKILIAGAVLGGIYFLFSKTINSAISAMYDKIKNGMMGLGDFIKKSASSIFSFFGNMFIKASECLNGDGVLTSVMITIISEFFSYTLPTLLVGLSEDLIRIIDSSFESSLNFDSHKLEAEDIQKTLKVETEGAASQMRKTTDEIMLSVEKDILEDNSLSVSEQEKAADKAIANFTSSFVNLANGLSQKSKEETEILKKWSSSVIFSLSNNNMAATAFYKNSMEALRAMDNILPFLDKVNETNITADQERLLEEFVRQFARELNLKTEEIEAFEELSTADQIVFLKKLNSSLTSFVDATNTEIETIKKSNQNKSGEDSLISIVKDIRKRMDNKDTKVEIIRFQEVKELGKLHSTIKSFVSDTRFDREVNTMTQILGSKFDSILDAANKSLDGLASLVSNDYTTSADGLSYTAEEDSNNKFASIPDSGEYKLMYIFNNVASANETSITKSMLEFVKNSTKHLKSIEDEIEIVQKLEKLIQSFCYAFLTDISHVQNNIVTNNKNLLEHILKPVSEKGRIDTANLSNSTTAHTLELVDKSIAAIQSGAFVPNHGALVVC